MRKLINDLVMPTRTHTTEKYWKYWHCKHFRYLRNTPTFSVLISHRIMNGAKLSWRGTAFPVLQLREGTMVTLLLNVPQTFFRSHKSITFARDVPAECTYSIRFAVNLGDGTPSPTQSSSGDNVCGLSD